MARRNDKSEVIDALLRTLALGGVTVTVLLAPGTAKMLDKPIQRFIKNLEAKERERELRQMLVYMKSKGLIKGSYDYGLEITDKARKRLAKLDIDKLAIKAPKRWDGKWRIIFYDIPESQKAARNAFSFKLRQLGCQQLQRSVWVHPFACQEEVSAVAASLEIDKYITYLEVSKISGRSKLIERFGYLKIKESP